MRACAREPDWEALKQGSFVRLALIRYDHDFYFAVSNVQSIEGFGRVAHPAENERKYAPIYRFLNKLRGRRTAQEFKTGAGVPPPTMSLIVDGDPHSLLQIMRALYLCEPSGVNLQGFTAVPQGFVGKQLGFDILPGCRLDERAFVDAVTTRTGIDLRGLDIGVAWAVALLELAPEFRAHLQRSH